MPLSHLSLELGHLYMEDFAAGPDRLRDQFARVKPWADAARASCAVPRGRPRISTCFLVDDYFSRFSSPAEVVPRLVAQAAESGLVIDYLARESACAEAAGVQPARLVESRLVQSPLPSTNGSRPPATEVGWLSNGRRSPTDRPAEAMSTLLRWQPPQETGAPRHSVFLDVELWDERENRRTWSCPFLAAVWQLLRLGLLRDGGREPLRPTDLTGPLPEAWDSLPPLLRLTPGAAPFAAYRTVSILGSSFLPIEHAVRVLLDQWAPDEAVLRQLVDRAAAEGIALADETADRIAYVFHWPS